ncbi:MAG: histidine kinase [Dehalococcoidia bacterium]|nr:histidine kinase [Dehalococcoidia bacterium]
MTVWALVPLVSFLTYIGLFVLTLQSRERRTGRVFALYLEIAGLWSFTSFMLHLNIFPEQVLFWNELVVVALVWNLITYYHFIRAYTGRPAGSGVLLGYVFLVALAALSFSGYIVQSSYVVEGVLYHDLGISLYFIGAISLTFIVAIIALLIKKNRGSSDPTDRNRTMYLMAGWSILVLFTYSNLVPALAGFPLDHIGNLANALIIAYAIRRYHLLDIKLVLQKGLVYSSLTLLLTAIYLLLLFTLQVFLQGWPYGRLALAAGFALLVVSLLNPLRHFIQKWIDRLFFGETYDYRQILLNFSHRVSNVLDLDQLAQSILEPIVAALHVSRAALLFPDSGSSDFSTRFTHQAAEEESPPGLSLSGDSPVVTWLAGEGKPLRREFMDVIPQFKSLWESERTAFSALGVELLCPIRSRRKLIGILALGKKQSDSPYSDDEVDLLMTMANEAAVSVENASMLESLRSQQLQVQQLLSQAVQTQEEERKRISVDLHDSVAQWLVAASYRVQTCSQLISGNGNAKVRDELSAMESTIDKSLKELRRVVIGLRPPALDELGLSHALQQSLGDLKAEGLECEFSEDGKPARLPPNLEIAVYRAVQEALTNVRKHAGATKVSLRLQFNEDEFVVEIHDNGKGFDLSRTLGSAISVGHMGLLGMKQRAETLGGNIRIRTSKGAGTVITLSFPVRYEVRER